MADEVLAETAEAELDAFIQAEDVSAASDSEPESAGAMLDEFMQAEEAEAELDAFIQAEEADKSNCGEEDSPSEAAPEPEALPEALPEARAAAAAKKRAFPVPAAAAEVGQTVTVRPVTGKHRRQTVTAQLESRSGEKVTLKWSCPCCPGKDSKTYFERNLVWL